MTIKSFLTPIYELCINFFIREYFTSLENQQGLNCKISEKYWGKSIQSVKRKYLLPNLQNLIRALYVTKSESQRNYASSSF